MKSLYTRIIIGLVIITGLAALSVSSAKPVLAYSPNLTIYNNNTSSGNYQVTVNVSAAAPYSSVSIYYLTSNGQAIVAGTFGQTDANGNFTIQEPYGNDSQSGITGRYAVIAGDTTNTVNSSTYSYGGSGGTNGGITFSQTNPNLNVGQSLSVTMYSQNSYGSGFYVSSNSNNAAVSAYVSGSTLMLSGLASGNSNILVCSTNSYSYNGNQCGTLYVTVSGGSNYNGSLTFSQTNPTLNIGQTLSVNIYTTYGSSSSYYISSNSNSSIAGAYISGSTLQISGVAIGNSSIMVCATGAYSYNGNQCGTLYVTVSNNGSSGSLTFSNSNTTISVGQTYSDSIYSPNNYGYTYYISNNTNSSVVSASISGSVVNLYGITNGSSSITVCYGNSGYYYGNSCGTLYVTVTGSSNSYSTITANPSNPYIAFGQNLAITLNQTVYNGYSSNNSYYISTNSNSNVVSANIVGNILNVYGINYGTDVITVCSGAYSVYGTNNSSCLPITITVNSTGSGTNGQNTSITFSQSNISVQSGQQNVVTISGGSYYNNYSTAQQYYISSNSNPSIVNASISGNQLSIYGNTVGNTTLTVCSNNNGTVYNYNTSNCGTLYVTVSSSGVQQPQQPQQILGANTYPNGELIQEGQQISIVYKNTKIPFSNYSAFTGLGYSASNVVNVGYSSLTQSSYAISTANASHPWGTWIKMGNTVYFVYEQGLIPISSYDVFTSNGGQPNFIVSANNYDYQLPVLSIMTYNDPRLQ